MKEAAIKEIKDASIRIAVDSAKKIITTTQSDSRIIHLPALEEGDMTRRLPDISKMLAILDRDLTSLDDGIKILLSALKV